MAFAAETELEVRSRKFSGIFQVLGDLAMAPCTGKGGMFASHLEGLDLVMALVARSLSLRDRFLCKRGTGEIERQRKKADE
jgi:hypothetical protein